MKNTLNRLAQSFRARAAKLFTARYYTYAWAGIYALAFAASPAHAQSLHDTAASIFDWIYTCVGILGAIALVTTAINWKLGNFFGAHNPKALFFQALIGTGIGFAVPSIILAIKAIVNTTGSGSSL